MGSANTPTQDVVRLIIDDINSGHLTSKEKIKIDYLKKRYHCSLSSVREALQRLTSSGIIHHAFNKGFYVATMSGDEFESIYLCREFVISKITERMQSFTPGMLHELFNRLSSIKFIAKDIHSFDRENITEWEKYNGAFYGYIIKNSTSVCLLKIYENLDHLSEPYRHSLFHLLDAENTQKFITKTLSLQDKIYHSVERNDKESIKNTLIEILNITISNAKKHAAFYQ